MKIQVLNAVITTQYWLATSFRTVTVSGRFDFKVHLVTFRDFPNQYHLDHLFSCYNSKNNNKKVNIQLLNEFCFRALQNYTKRE